MKLIERTEDSRLDDNHDVKIKAALSGFDACTPSSAIHLSRIQERNVQSVDANFVVRSRMIALINTSYIPYFLVRSYI